jgi:[ribosomal protein S5]-alanine N-acetyltransferase
MQLVPASAEHVDALIEGDDVFTERFGWTVAPGYLEFPEALGPTRAALHEGTPAQWYAHLFVDTAAGEVVGFGGFKGPPTNGEVEIGYSVAPSHRGRGVATTAARLMIESARAAGVRVVCAHTLAEDGPSTAVLRRVGMHNVAELDDPDVGLVWRWELAIEDP